MNIILNIVGYILAILISHLWMYYLAKHHLTKSQIVKKLQEMGDAINDVADIVETFNSDKARTVADVLREISWYIKNDKVRDQANLIEDVKKHIS